MKPKVDFFLISKTGKLLAIEGKERKHCLTLLGMREMASLKILQVLSGQSGIF